MCTPAGGPAAWESENSRALPGGGILAFIGERAGLANGGRGAERRFDVIKDPGTGLAMEHLVAAQAAHLLKNMGTDTHAASAALLIAHFSKGNSVMLSGDAFVVV